MKLKPTQIGWMAAGAIAAVAMAGGLQASPRPAEVAAIGKPVTEWKLKDVTRDLKDGEKDDAAIVDLAKYRGKKSVVLFFMSEKCGTTWRYEKRVGEMLKQAPKQGVVWLGVRSSGADTPETIRKYAEVRHFDMPILDDTKNRMANYYRARVTPTFVVIDKQGVMRYFGSFDDSAVEGGVSKRYLSDAISAVVAGKEVPEKRTAPFG